MRKIIKRKIHISTHKRDLIDFINDEFYSHDKHNAFIEFTMKGLPTDNIIALFYFQKTKRYVETKAFVDGDKFTIEFDTSLINTDETVLGFIYFEKVAQSADVHRFSFGVKVSEIDKLHDMPIQEAKTKRVVAIEDIVTKAELDELFKRIEKNGGTYNDTEIRNSISSIETRVQTLETRPQIDTSKLVTKEELEAKGYLSTAPDLSEYAKKSEIPTQFDSKPLIDRIESLETKAIANGAYNDKLLLDKIHEVQESLKGFITQSSRYLVEHQSLAHLVTKDELVSKGYINAHQSLEHLVTKDELANKGYLTAHQDISGLVTKQELEDKHYIQEHQSLANLVTKDELEAKGYLKAHQSLEEYAKKSEIPHIDTTVFATKEELAVVKQNQDTSNTEAYVTKDELSQKGYLTAHQSLENVVTKAELEQKGYLTEESLSSINRTIGEQSTKITALQSKAEFEIHGTGMPNGQVEAPIGTTYVDMAVTNGALKWIKQSSNGNTGWKVLIGDTGWRTLNSVSRAGNSFIKIRRVNNLVTYQFGGLQWGWFGVGRRNGPGFVRHNSSGDKGAKLTYPNGIPEGFRSENSLVGPTYDDKGRPYGIWYLGGKSDLNFIQFTFNENIPTDKDIGDIRVSAISYITDEDWPTRLP